MSAAVSLNPVEAGDSSGPIESFANCHGGIVANLEQLGELPDLLAPAMRARDLAERALSFFREALFEHHLDEERELFPAVQSAAEKGEEADRVRTMTTWLVDQHRELEQLWKRIEPGLRRLVKGSPSEVSGEDIATLVARYRAHASFEEAEFLPLAKTILGRKSFHLEALGMSLHMRHVSKKIPAWI